MKINLLLGYRFKIFFLALSLFAIAGTLLGLHREWMHIILLLSLFGIIFSAEKNENERISRLRDTVLKMSFIIMFSVFFALLVVSTTDPYYPITGESIFLVLLLTSVFHLVVFYIKLFGNKKQYLE